MHRAPRNGNRANPNWVGHVPTMYGMHRTKGRAPRKNAMENLSEVPPSARPCAGPTEEMGESNCNRPNPTEHLGRAPRGAPAWVAPPHGTM